MRLVAVLIVALLATACGESSAPAGRSASPAVSSGRASATADENFHVVAATRLGARDVLMIANVSCPVHADGCTGLYRSTDDGTHWTSVPAPPGDLGDARIAFAAPEVGVVVERNDETGAGATYRTDDGGAHWSKLPLAAVSDAAVTGRIVYLLADGRLYAAAAGARSFAQVAAISATDFSVSGSALVADTSVPRLARPGDFDVIRGRSVLRRASPCTPVTWSQAVIASPSGVVLAVCGSEPGTGNQLKTTFLSHDDGTTWRRESAPGIGGYVECGAAGGDGVFAAGERMNPVVTTDGGRSWHVAITGSGTAGGFGEIGFSDSLHGWAIDGGPPPALYLTDDGGRTWHAAARPPSR